MPMAESTRMGLRSQLSSSDATSSSGSSNSADKDCKFDEEVYDDRTFYSVLLKVQWVHDNYHDFHSCALNFAAFHLERVRRIIKQPMYPQ